MNPDTSFAGLVKGRRLALGMSQAALADLVGRSASAVRSWERGASTPSDENVIRSLAAVLGIDEASLRVAVGLPPEEVAEEPDVVGGEALEAFVEEREDDLADGDGTPAAATRDTETSPQGVGSEAVAIAEETGAAEIDLPDVGVGENDSPTDQALEGSALESPAVEGSPLAAVEPGETIPAGELDADLVADGPAGGYQIDVVQPIVPAVSAMTVPTATISAGGAPPQPEARSYLDDPDQMTTYWIRAALTVAFTALLLVVLFWALGRLGDSIGEVWEIFKSGA